MQRSPPPLGWFRAFEAAARHLSFTRAADELRLTQSAISQQIRSLEARLGVRLFVRQHRRIMLTDEGRRLLPDVAQAMTSLRLAAATFEAPEEEALLTVATSVSVAEWVIAPQLQEFLQICRGSHVRFLTSVWPDELIASSADITIRFGPADNDSRLLGSDQLVLVATPELLASNGATKFSADTIGDFTLIHAVGTSDVWSNCAAHLGYDPELKPAISVDSHGLSVDFALSGTGIALTSQLIAARALGDGRLVKVHPATIPAKDNYHISIAADSRHAHAAAFVDWVAQVADSLCN